MLIVVLQTPSQWSKGRIMRKRGIGQCEGQGTGWDIQTVATVLDDNHGSINLAYSLAVKDIATQTSRNGRANLPNSCPSCWTPHCPPSLCHYCSKIRGVLLATLRPQLRVQGHHNRVTCGNAVSRAGACEWGSRATLPLAPSERGRLRVHWQSW